MTDSLLIAEVGQICSASAGSTSLNLSNLERPCRRFRTGVSPTGNGGPFCPYLGPEAGRLCHLWLEDRSPEFWILGF